MFAISIKMGNVRNVIDHGSYCDLNLPWERASKHGGCLVGKGSLSEQSSPQWLLTEWNKCGELTAKQVSFLVIYYLSVFVGISVSNACTCMSLAQSCYKTLSFAVYLEYSKHLCCMFGRLGCSEVCVSTSHFSTTRKGNFDPRSFSSLC